jgi:hypothetical protein
MSRKMITYGSPILIKCFSDDQTKEDKMCGYVTLQECIQGFFGGKPGEKRRRKKHTHTWMTYMQMGGRYKNGS